MAAFMWGPQEDINNKPLYFRHRLLDTINHIIDVCIVTRVESFEGRNQKDLNNSTIEGFTV